MDCDTTVVSGPPLTSMQGERSRAAARFQHCYFHPYLFPLCRERISFLQASSQNCVNTKRDRHGVINDGGGRNVGTSPVNGPNLEVNRATKHSLLVNTAAFRAKSQNMDHTGYYASAINNVSSANTIKNLLNASQHQSSSMMVGKGKHTRLQ